MDKLETINAYVVANEKRLKALCMKLYRGNELGNDLFGEFYLEVIKTPNKTLEKYELKNICYWCIVRIYQNRTRPKHGLEPSRRHQDLTGVEIATAREYTIDIEEFIDFELNRPTGFAEMTVFMEWADGKSLHQLSRESGVHMKALSGYKCRAQKRLQELCR